MNVCLDQIDIARFVPPEPLTVEAFWRLGERNPDLRMELEPNGDLIIMTPTERGTGFRGIRILQALSNWADADGRGYPFESSTAFVLPDGSVRSPDASWIAQERWSPDAEDSYNRVLCPDFVIELRSKTDRLPGARAKMQAWIDNGVKLAWLIDPSRKTVEIYRPGQPVEIQVDEAAVHGEGPVGGFVLELGRIWA